MLVLHRKIQELKNRSTPISYTNTSVNEFGQLVERENLLDQRIVEGYGNIWNKKNSHNERFYKGAWSESIANNGPGSNANYQIKLRDEHGRACALMDVLKEDEIGLYFRSKPLDNCTWCDDLLTQLRSKTINNFSNGFRHLWDDKSISFNEKDDTFDIFRARLFEVSAVSVPSDMETFAVRSVHELETISEDVEEFILSLPKARQLEARKLLTRCMTLNTTEQSEQSQQTQTGSGQSKAGLDFKFLMDNFKLS